MHGIGVQKQHILLHFNYVAQWIPDFWRDILNAVLQVISAGQEKRIFFLGAQPGDKNFLQTNGVFLC
jgi:hypothetical protein